MRIFGFVRALYGRQAVLGGAGVLLLSVLLSAAQFLSAWQLGRMLDAVSAGLSDVLAEAALLTAAVAAQFAADVLLFRLMQGMTLRLSNLLHGKLTEKLCRAAYKPLSLRDDGELMTTITESAEGWAPAFRFSHRSRSFRSRCSSCSPRFSASIGRCSPSAWCCFR